MALAKIKLDAVDVKATPVLADSVLLSDSEDGGRGKLSTLTALQTLIGGGAVDSVAGKTGVVTLDADDVSETATKLWFTDTERAKLTGLGVALEPSGIDDTVAMQAAIDAGGIVQLGAGTYIVTSVDVSNDVIIQGVGNETIIKRKDNHLTNDVGDVYDQPIFALQSWDISFVLRDLTVDGNEANQTPIDPYGCSVALNASVCEYLNGTTPLATDRPKITIYNVRFANEVYSSIYAFLPQASTVKAFVTAENCIFENGAEGLPQGHEGTLLETGYAPNAFELRGHVVADISNCIFRFDATLADDTYSRTAVFITESTDGATGANVTVSDCYFYRMGRGLWLNGSSVEQHPQNALGVVEAYNFGQELIVRDCRFISSIGTAIRMKSNCQNVVLSGNNILNSGLNDGISITPASLLEQVGRLTITDNTISSVTSWGIAIVGNPTGGHAREYAEKSIISHNRISTIASSLDGSTTFGDGIYTNNIYGLVIDGNIITGATIRGIWINGNSGSDSSRDISILNNQIQSTSYCIFTTANIYKGQLLISDNVFSSSGNGIYINGNTGQMMTALVQNNNIITANLYGYLFKGVSDIIALGNTAEAVTGGSAYLFYVETCNNSLILSNNVKSSGVANGLIGPTGTGKFHNFGNSWNPRISYGTAAPAAGTYAVGDIVYNTAPTPSGYTGWICTTAGTPGTWKGFGVIES